MAVSRCFRILVEKSAAIPPREDLMMRGPGQTACTTSKVPNVNFVAYGARESCMLASFI